MLWGIDLGGTKIEGIVLSAPSSDGVVERIRVKTEREKGYQHILSQITSLVETLRERTKSVPTLIGVGAPGSLHPETETLRNSNTLCLNGKSLRRDLERSLNCRVQIANDANCFALAEATLGAAQGYRTVFGVILGTGVGGGIVHASEVIGGTQGIGGEWGHNVLDPDGPQCYCGKAGCVETLISGPALERYYEQLTGEALSLDQIEATQQTSDIAAQQTIARLNSLFGRAIAVVVNILDPDCIVLGGGVSNIESLYSQGVLEAKRFIFSNTPELSIVRNQLGDSAGVFGAALLTIGGPSRSQ